MKKQGVIFIIALILLIGVFGIIKMTGHATSENREVKIETNYWNIVLELYPDKAPVTVENFENYVKQGFYDGTIFHRVIDGFMIQGGGIDAKTGAEKNTDPPIKLESDNGLKNERGTIAMARTNKPNSATSQFFINTVDNDFLNYGTRDQGYAVFGKVIEGMDVVDKISKVKTDSNGNPITQVVIEKVSLN